MRRLLNGIGCLFVLSLVVPASVFAQKAALNESIQRREAATWEIALSLWYLYDVAFIYENIYECFMQRPRHYMETMATTPSSSPQAQTPSQTLRTQTFFKSALALT